GGCADLVHTMRLNRRELFQIGNVGMMSGGLMSLLAARARAAGGSADQQSERATARACIILFQVGGPYQCDTFDPKPLAPEEARGPFKPAATKTPGLRVTTALPEVARHTDKLALLRSVNHTIRCHNPAIYCSLAGREATDP